MHISEGVLSAPVLVGGVVFAVCGLTLGLRKLDWKHLAQVSVLSAAFFIASLIHVPLGPGNVHLIMNGLLGAVLGWSSFPAITVALFLQALLFQYGGLTSLGTNVTIMALPALVCGLFFRPFFQSKYRSYAAFACGAGAIFFSALLCALALSLSGDEFITAAWALFLAHIPIMVIEGIITLVAVTYINKVLPELLLGQKTP